jgi:chromosome segregation ATPase
MKRSLEELQQEQADLEAEEESLRAKTAVGSSADLLLQSIKAKAAPVEQMKKRLVVIQDEVFGREREVRELERRAANHEIQIHEANDRLAAFERQRLAAEEKKRKLLASISSRDEKRKLLIEQRDKIRERREEAEREQQELDELEKELARDEEQLQQEKRRDDEVAQASKLENRTVEKPRNRVDEFLSKYAEVSLANDRKTDRLEKQLVQRRANLTLAQTRFNTLWKEKHQDADQLITMLEQKISFSENATVLLSKCTDLEAELPELKEKVRIHEQQLRTLQESSEREKALLPRLQAEAAEEQAKLRQLERDLDAKTLQQQIESNDLDTQQEEVKLRKAELEAQIQVLEAKGAAGKRVLELYEQQLAAAERRSRAMKAERLRMEKGP